MSHPINLLVSGSLVSQAHRWAPFRFLCEIVLLYVNIFCGTIHTLIYYCYFIKKYQKINIFHQNSLILPQKRSKNYQILSFSRTFHRKKWIKLKNEMKIHHSLEQIRKWNENSQLEQFIKWNENLNWIIYKNEMKNANWIIYKNEMKK